MVDSFLATATMLGFGRSEHHDAVPDAHIHMLPGWMTLFSEAPHGQVVFFRSRLAIWGDFWPDDHESTESFERERTELDEAFAAYEDDLRAVFGIPSTGQCKPVVSGIELSERWAKWDMESGCLILALTCYEPEFGIEVSVWHFAPPAPKLDEESAFLAQALTDRVGLHRHPELGGPSSG